MYKITDEMDRIEKIRKLKFMELAISFTEKGLCRYSDETIHSYKKNIEQYGYLLFEERYKKYLK